MSVAQIIAALIIFYKRMNNTFKNISVYLITALFLCIGLFLFAKDTNLFESNSHAQVINPFQPMPQALPENQQSATVNIAFTDKIEIDPIITGSLH